MKNRRRICLPVTLLLLCFALTLCALAAGSGGGTGTAYAGGFVENPDGVLTAADVTSLQSAAAAAAVQVGANVGVIFTDSGYSESRLRDTADQLYDRECDQRSDAIILAVDISSRNYYIRTIGRMNDNLSGSAFDRIESQTKSQLKESNWKSAALSFIGAVAVLTPEDLNGSSDSGNLAFAEAIIIVIGLAAGFITAGILAYRMNNARRGKNAANYVKDHSFSLDKSADLYLYSTVTKTRVQTDSNRSGGGSSGGSSRGGRGGSF